MATKKSRGANDISLLTQWGICLQLEPVFSKAVKYPKYTVKRYIGEDMGYSSNLTDSQWEIIKPIFKSKKGNNLVKHNKRDLINAVLY